MQNLYSSWLQTPAPYWAEFMFISNKNNTNKKNKEKNQ